MEPTARVSLSKLELVRPEGDGGDGKISERGRGREKKVEKLCILSGSR